MMFSNVQRRPLMLLTVAVLAAHLAVLWASPGSVDLTVPVKTGSFLTRSVAAAPAAAVAEPAPAPPPVAEVVPAPVSKPKPPPARAQRPKSATNSAANAAATTLPEGSAARGAVFGPAPAVETQAGADASTPVAVSTQTFSVPGTVRLHYEVTANARGFNVRSKAELLMQHDGRNYEAKLEVGNPVGPARVQRSAGAITPMGLVPFRFSDKARSEEAAHFEHDKGKLSFSGNRPEAPLLAGAQDRLSVILQLGAMIAGDPRRYPAATTISIQTASAREADVWQFTVEPEELLQLPGGATRALKLIRTPRKEFDVKVELWLAPGMDYAPVRLRLTQPNGEWLDQQWSATDKG